MAAKTERLTMAQAVVRCLCSRFIEIDEERVPLLAGVFGILGHGNVTCLAGALDRVQDQLPMWRGQNEQSMALAAIAYAGAKRRRQVMVATSSVGPGATTVLSIASDACARTPGGAGWHVGVPEVCRRSRHARACKRLGPVRRKSARDRGSESESHA